MNPDPMRQYVSLYMAMGNNPVMRIDPNGGEDLTGDAATLALADANAATASRLPMPFNPIHRASALGFQERGRNISWLNNTSFAETQAAVAHSQQVMSNLSTTAAVGIGLPMLTMLGAPVLLEANGTVGALVNRGAAYTYLVATGNTGAFVSGSASITISMGTTAYRYHGSLRAAVNGSYSTLTRFSNSGTAFNRLALDFGTPNAIRYNMAQFSFTVRQYGLYINGTAASQGMTSGGGQQMLRVGAREVISKGPY